MTILSIETSCDETSVALVKPLKSRLSVVRHIIASQASMHKKYGGVVPEVAARQHLVTLPIILDKEIGRSAIEKADMIAVTHGPGLITSLMVGVQTAKTLSYLFKKPLLGVNHLEAHIYANWLTYPALYRNANKFFPSLILIVSGGHTMLVLMRGPGRYLLLGETLDDAVGEAFDKVARLLDLGYPGGPAVARLATKGRADAIDFPRPMARTKGYDMSFSGLKTSVLYHLRKKRNVSAKELPDIAASFQSAAVDVLISRMRAAAEQYAPASLMVVGGVAANRSLRTAVAQLGSARKIPVFVPERVYTGDNAAMIAAVGYVRRNKARINAWRDLSPFARDNYELWKR